MQTLRPHEQAQVDRAKLSFKPSSQGLINTSRIDLTGKRYKHKLTEVVYREVSVFCGLPYNPPILAWVQKEDEEDSWRVISIPLELLHEI